MSSLFTAARLTPARVSSVLQRSAVPLHQFGNPRLFSTSNARMDVEEIHTSEGFQQALRNPENKPVLVDFFATWCGPCNTIAPHLNDLSNKHSDILFRKVNVETLEDVTSNNNIRAMPTFVLYEQGKEKQRITGANLGALKQALNIV